ncbi:hypothetical protein JRO89_XS07G0213700 [Xanthoceras sorbifolium]|uniref:Uncharacterized protein n=1 Tax=Xanthoceras sorbifolium TaxID=99658 RepID=A0ABQ8HUF9_9ROSI|nr:hypothetical protein JRO89_XS07G0213700 [Xanthoceras sorbifolium]
MLSGIVVVARGHPGRSLGTHLIDLNFNHNDYGKYFSMFENFWHLVELMRFINISAKFLGTQSDFIIDQPKEYTLSALFTDVYLFTCSKLPDPFEKFKAEVKLPWSSKYKLVKDDSDLQQILSRFIVMDIRCVRVDIELLPLDTLPLLDSFNKQCPYPKETCTPEPVFVYISTDKDREYPEDDMADLETYDVADSEDLSESNYNPNSCEVVQEDDTAGSNSETVPAVTVNGEDCNEDKSEDDSDDE